MYQYDAIGRLTSAVTGATGPQWGNGFVFDGFGNLLQKNVTKGSAPALSITVSAATNRISMSGFGCDNNGNQTAAPGWTYAYDIANRMVSAYSSGVGTDLDQYDTSNQRVCRKKPSGQEDVFFYGVDGKMLALEAATAYGAYRVGRLLPSLFPPLWWTLPLNVVVP